MSYERAMDPNDDPERRQARRREAEQLELPFSESVRPDPDDTDEARAKRAKRLKERADGPEQA